MDLADGFTIPSERIDKDLEMLSKRFEGIRTYSTVGLEEVPKYARKHDLKVMLGAWIGGDEKQNSAEIKTLISPAKEYPDVISRVVVGNEVLLRGGSLPSPIAQTTFIRGFLDLAQKEGYSYNLIEAYDQPWKIANEGAVGGYWGLYDANGADKSAIFGAVSEYKNHEWLFLLSLLFLSFSFVMQIKYKSNSHKAILFSVIASALFALQFNQYQIVQKDLIDYA